LQPEGVGEDGARGQNGGDDCQLDPRRGGSWQRADVVDLEADLIGAQPVLRQDLLGQLLFLIAAQLVGQQIVG